MIWKIALQLIAVLTAIFIANLDYLWHDKSTLKFKRTRLFLYFLAGITLILSVVVTIQDDRQHKDEINQLTSSLCELKKETSTLRTEAQNTGKEQTSKMEELIDGNKRLQDSLAPFQDIAKKRYPGLESKDALEKLKSDITAVEKRAAELEKKVEASDPVLQPIRAAKATVELQVESDDQVSTMFIAGGHFVLARGKNPILIIAGDGATAKQLGNSRVLWRAVWNMDASDRAVGKQVKSLKEAEYCQINFQSMPKDSKIINGSVRLTINNDVQLDFVIPRQKASGDKIFIRDISSVLNLLQEKGK